MEVHQITSVITVIRYYDHSLSALFHKCTPSVITDMGYLIEMVENAIFGTLQKMHAVLEPYHIRIYLIRPVY